MDKRKIALIALAVVVTGAGSAFFLAARGRAAIKEARVLHAEMALLTQARDDTIKQATDLRTDFERSSAALAQAEADLAAARRANIDLGNKLAGYSEELVHKQSEQRRAGETQRQLLEQLRGEVDQRKVTITRLGNALSVSLAGHMLFGSGQAGLTADGIEVLTRVGAVIKQATDQKLRVVGHTDNRPISANRQALYPTNWELSTARAAAVVHFLVDTLGIAPERCEAVGMGEFRPLATNETSAGRMQNRRIEIELAAPLPNAEAVETPTTTAPTPAQTPTPQPDDPAAGAE
jgi:chemotaxis protein MotB